MSSDKKRVLKKKGYVSDEAFLRLTKIEERMRLKEKDLKKEIKLLKEYIKDWSFF